MNASRNRLANAHNRFQGTRKKVLCVCSAGLLRSPTAAWVLSNEPFGFNTRAVGAESDFALIVLDEAHVFWADEIVVMSNMQKRNVDLIQDKLKERFGRDPVNVFVTDVPDTFSFRDPELVESFTNLFKKHFNIE
jgi:predicted protein tyrosine phosphatase